MVDEEGGGEGGRGGERPLRIHEPDGLIIGVQLECLMPYGISHQLDGFSIGRTVSRR